MGLVAGEVGVDGAGCGCCRVGSFYGSGADGGWVFVGGWVGGCEDGGGGEEEEGGEMHL